MMRGQIDRLRNIADNASDPEVRDTLRDIAKRLSFEHAFESRANTMRSDRLRCAVGERLKFRTLDLGHRPAPIRSLNHDNSRC